MAKAFELDSSQTFLVQQHKIPPTETTVRKIAQLTGVSFLWIMDGSPSVPRDYILDRYIPSYSHEMPVPNVSKSSIMHIGYAGKIAVHVENS